MSKHQAFSLGLVLSAMCGVNGCNRISPADPAPQYFSDQLRNGAGAPLLVRVPAGKGTIGGTNFRSFQNEEPQIKVKIENPFAIGAKEVTFAEFDLFCQSTEMQCPSDEGWGRGAQPVVNVSWHDAVGYTEWLSQQTGKAYRLPTEVEWEYAARAGRDTKYWWGDEYREGIDHCDRTQDTCPAGTDQGQPVTAGHFQINPFGLYDVTSNVSEWVFDCYTADHTDASKAKISTAVEQCPERVMKGASWLNPRPLVHLSARFPVAAEEEYSSLGFRVMRELGANEFKEQDSK